MMNKKSIILNVIIKCNIRFLSGIFINCENIEVKKKKKILHSFNLSLQFIAFNLIIKFLRNKLGNV